MNTIRKILLPTDFSHSAQIALDYAIQFAGRNKSLKIFVLHVLDNDADERRADAEQEMKKIEQQIARQTNSECHSAISTGSLVDVVLDMQQEQDIDLILMGTSGLAGEHTETRASRLVLEADCPVLVVPAHASALQIKNIALALDLEAFDDTFSLGVVHNIARWYGAKVHILTVNNKPDGSLPSRKQVEDTLDYYLDTLDYHYAFPKDADILQGIQQYVEEHQIDMLAVLPRNHAKQGKPSEGRLTKLLALHTRVPLLTVD